MAGKANRNLSETPWKRHGGHLALILMLLSFSLPTYALDKDGNGSTAKDAVALYTFNDASGTIIRDSAPNPLNLQIKEPANVKWGNGYLSVLAPTDIISVTGDSKIATACQASNEFSLEIWFRTNTVPQAMDRTELVNMTNGDKLFNFRLMQMNSGIISPYIKTSRSSAGIFYSGFHTAGMSLPQPGVDTHITLVKTNHDDFYMYVDGNLVSSDVTTGGVVRWDQGEFLKMASNWVGDLEMLAVYCRALTPAEATDGRAALGNTPPVVIDPQGIITPARKKALELFTRVAGVKVPIDDPRVKQMEVKLLQGDQIGAAAIATTDPHFYDVTVKTMAAQMSTRDESAKSPLSDFVATVIGATRDDLDARTLLYGNYYYAADPALAAVPHDLVADILESNNQYDALEEQHYHLGRVLKRYDGLMLSDGRGHAVPNPDPAGIISSRAFLEAHATAGTNRRLVQYTLREFTCIPIQKWADASLSDFMVGRDVDRYPGGDNKVFKSTCKACHSGMDALRPAFGHVDFRFGYVQDSQAVTSWSSSERSNTKGTIQADSNGIVLKMNHNSDVYPAGYVIKDTHWVNQLTTGSNAKYFGWRGPLKGSGMHDFGKMVANSKAFSRCMVERVYRQECKRDISSFENNMVQNVSQEFEKHGYQLKWLFEAVAADPTCLGK